MIAFFIVMMLMISNAQAHLPDRPDLNPWAMDLKNQGGVPCCDNDAAVPLAEPNWQVDTEGRYRVYIDGEWFDVPDAAVLKVPNPYGRTLVWYFKNVNGIVYVRCFLPTASF